MNKQFWGSLAILTTFTAAASSQTEVIARDIRKLGDGRCEASVAVRYKEAYAPMAESPRLLRTSQQTVPCDQAGLAADQMTRHLESELLLQAQDQVNRDNTRIRSFNLVSGAALRTEATFESPVLRRLPRRTELSARSVTPNWYAVTDAFGFPTGGYFHFSAINAESAQPQPVLGEVAASCNARLRSAPHSKARVIKQLRCGQTLHVVATGQDGWYELVSADGSPQKRFVNASALRPRTQVQ